MNCPTRQHISDYLLGKLPDKQFGEIAAHLESCEGCEHAAAELDSQSNSLFASLVIDALKASDDARPRLEPALLKESLDKAMRLAREETASAYLEETAYGGDDEAQMQLLLKRLSPPQATDELGRLGGFRILEVLGVGGMGVVFRGEDPSLRRGVAIKVLKPAAAAIPSAKARFLREARAAAAIEHDHVIAIHQISEDRGEPFFTMPLLSGVSLRDRLVAEQRLSLAEVLRIGRETAEALDAAHQKGLLHRDVKPDNIWLEGQHGRVKILDFGLARLIDSDAELTATNQIVGTPRYMSPEQALGQAVDHRADLFSLGCVLYRMATGKSPFSGSSATATLIAVVHQNPVPIQQQDPHLPPSFCRLVDRLLAKQPDARYQSAGEVIAALQAIEDELPPGTASSDAFIPKQAGELQRRTRNRRLLAVAAIVPLVVLGVAIAVQRNRATLPQIESLDMSPQAKQEPAERAPATSNAPTTASKMVGAWTPADGWLPLIPLLDPTAEGMQGAFQVVDGRLASGGTRTLIPFPLEIDGDYLLEATIREWTIKENHHADFFLPTCDGKTLFFRLGIDATNTGTGCYFRDASDAAAAYFDLPFSPGDRVHLMLHMSREGDLMTAAAVINGQQVTSCSRRVNGPAQAAWPSRLTLMDLMPAREYSDLRLRMLTGTAEIVANSSTATTTK